MQISMRWFKNLFSCVTLDPIQQEEFDREQGIKTAYNMRFVSLVIIAVVIIFSIIDYGIISEEVIFKELNTLRAIFVLFL